MGPDLKLPDASASKANGVVFVDSQNRCLKHDANCDLRNLKMDRSGVQPSAACTCNEMDVNVTDFTNPRGNEMVRTEDETDCSSSFDDSDCGSDNPFSDTEVESHNHGDSTSDFAINGFGDFLRMRRKRLTPHWKNFIQPLMWRCRWLELQIRKCHSQALKYDRALAAYNLKDSNYSGEGICVKQSLPFSTDGIPKDKVMHRKKRRKIEDTEDIASYMSNHILFSYEGKRHHAANGARMVLDLGTQVKTTGYDDHDHESDERLWLRAGDVGDSLEGLFIRFDTLQSKLKNLRARLNKVTCENAVQSLPSPASSGDRMPALASCISSKLQSQHNMGSLVRPKIAFASNGDASYIPAAVEITDQTNLQDKCLKVKDMVLISNDNVKEEMYNFGEAMIRPIEKHLVATMSCQQGTVPVDLDEPELPRRAPKRHSLGMLIVPKGKRKRGRRRASTNWWTRKVSC